jgi:RHS repeat-associated protein
MNNQTLRVVMSLALVLLSCLGFASAQAQTTLNPTADAYVQGGGNANTNFGTNTQLRIQTNATSSSNYDSYLKFDTTGQTFATAKVRVNAALSASGTVGVALYAVATTTWGETTINWNNKPARGAQQATTVNVTSTTAAWIEFDVTSYVLAEKTAGRPIVSFALHAPSNVSVRVNASSKEATTNKPQLVLTASANNPPTVSLTAPANNATFTAPATINLSATASDSDGTVSKVEFFQGTTLIATVTTSPYTATWSNVATGVYSLTAKATDNLNAVTTSTPVAITVNPPVQAYYIHSDHLNTPRVISDQNQKTVWRWQNTEGFGNTLAEEDPDNDGITFTCNLRYPGQYYDKETALHYNGYRDYDPSTGRYVESDPIGLKAGVNTFAYGGNNPLHWVDPWGLAQCYYSITDHALVCFQNAGNGIATAQSGVSSGVNECENKPSCADAKNKGPVPPDVYNVTKNDLPGRQGWWALQSTSWIPGLSGLSCRLGRSRCGYNLHLGTYSLGCITFNKNDPNAVSGFNSVNQMLQSDSPNIR